jgi:hypothetical protein
MWHTAVNGQKFFSFWTSAISERHITENENICDTSKKKKKKKKRSTHCKHLKTSGSNVFTRQQTVDSKWSRRIIFSRKTRRLPRTNFLIFQPQQQQTFSQLLLPIVM